MNEKLQLAGQVVIVTGSSYGIGAAIAERLGSAGAHVIVSARTMRQGQGTDRTVERIRERGGVAEAVRLDMEHSQSREALINGVIERHGRLDILVNNAGTADYRPTDVMPLSAARAQVETYFLGPWHLCHLVLPYMKRSGQGRILNIGSCVLEPPTRPFDAYNEERGFEALYAGVKTGLSRFSLGLAAEVSGDNIAVNVLAPVGAVFTPGVASLDLGLTTESEICEPAEDMAEAALEILSRPIDYTGNVEFSHQFLARIGRSTRTLDGKNIVVSRAPKGNSDV